MRRGVEFQSGVGFGSAHRPKILWMNSPGTVGIRRWPRQVENSALAILTIYYQAPFSIRIVMIKALLKNQKGHQRGDEHVRLDVPIEEKWVQ